MGLHGDFKDYFSRESGNYARFRPRYPAALFEYLASLVPEHRLAWDAGTGNGQAAVALAEHFEFVVGTDASEQQLANAEPHSRVQYRCCLAETSGLEPATVDLATAAQALHWFDRDAYFAEVQRVLRPGGAVAVWGYSALALSVAELTGVVDRFARETVGPWWTDDRRLVDDEYATIAFPFAEETVPRFVLSALWSLPELVGYLSTWSAVRRYREAQGHDPIPEVAADLATAWGEDERHRVEWPLFLRVGRPA